MKKNSHIGIIFAVTSVIFLSSFTNVVSVQIVKFTNPTVIKDDINQKELLFQTILDMANNREIQNIVLKSDIRRGGFFDTGEGLFSIFNPYVFTKKFLNNAYRIGELFSKLISPLKMHLLLERYQANNQVIQNKIGIIIEKNIKLKEEIMQLSNSNCCCEYDNITRLWNFPVLCLLLFPLFIISFVLYIRYNSIYLIQIMEYVGSVLNCFWLL